MSEQVKVSSVDVQRAQLLVRLNRALNKPTPEYVLKIADARPVLQRSLAPHSSTNRCSPGKSSSDTTILRSRPNCCPMYAPATR